MPECPVLPLRDLPILNKLFYFEPPHPLLVEILWGWALQQRLGTLGRLWGWALQGDSGWARWETLGSGDSLGLRTLGRLWGWASGVVLGWALQGVGHSRDTLSRPGEEKSSGEEFRARRRVEFEI